MSSLLDETAHRPWPLPGGAPAMEMTWRSLLFAHWALPADAIRPLVPAGLELDTRDGMAWVGVVPFRMDGVGPRRLNNVPWLSSFLELNVRTYVTAEGKPGVLFFSLDAANPVAVEIARRWFHLPYFNARMRLSHDDGWVAYRSERTHRGVEPGRFAGRYRAGGDAFRSGPGSIEEWLTERYCLYSADGRGRVYRGEIHHRPWLLQPAEAEFEENGVADKHGIALPGAPDLLHFAGELKVVAWNPTRVG